MPDARLSAGLLLAASVACSPAPQTAERDGAAETTVAAAGTAPIVPGTVLPPADAARRYVGKWATDRDLCLTGAWTIDAGRLATPRGVSCAFEEVEAIPGGYRIAAQCSVEEAATTSDERFTMRFAESARAMLVEGLRPVADKALIYCGPA